jgi:hypothetical protein
MKSEANMFKKQQEEVDLVANFEYILGKTDKVEGGKYAVEHVVKNWDTAKKSLNSDKARQLSQLIRNNATEIDPGQRKAVSAILNELQKMQLAGEKPQAKLEAVSEIKPQPREVVSEQPKMKSPEIVRAEDKIKAVRENMDGWSRDTIDEIRQMIGDVRFAGLSPEEEAATVAKLDALQKRVRKTIDARGEISESVRPVQPKEQPVLRKKPVKAKKTGWSRLAFWK